ncbi:MAG: TIGR03936 family radical SAM-associated protein [Kosmotogaceae bacterium]
MPSYVFRFVRGGIIRYLSQKETDNAIQRYFKRAGISMRFTEGYHPRPRMVFTPPVPTGVASTAWYVQIETTEKLKNLSQLQKYGHFTLKPIQISRVPDDFKLQKYIEAFLYNLYLPIQRYNPDRFVPEKTVTKKTKKSVRKFRMDEAFEDFSCSKLHQYFVVKYTQHLNKAVKYYELLDILSTKETADSDEEGVYVIVTDVVFRGKKLSEIIKDIGGENYVWPQ